jgi:hypothetical protein
MTDVEFEWPDITADAHGLDYTATDQEVLEAMEEAAEETGQDLETIHSKILDVLGLNESKEFQASSLPEAIASPTAGANPDAEDPRLEALDLYLIRQQI